MNNNSKKEIVSKLKEQINIKQNYLNSPYFQQKILRVLYKSAINRVADSILPEPNNILATPYLKL